jgi:hypothetical protein
MSKPKPPIDFNWDPEWFEEEMRDKKDPFLGIRTSNTEVYPRETNSQKEITLEDRQIALAKAESEDKAETKAETGAIRKLIKIKQRPKDPMYSRDPNRFEKGLREMKYPFSGPHDSTTEEPLEEVKLGDIQFSLARDDAEAKAKDKPNKIKQWLSQFKPRNIAGLSEKGGTRRRKHKKTTCRSHRSRSHRSRSHRSRSHRSRHCRSRCSRSHR